MDKIMAQISESFTLLGEKLYSWLDQIVLSLPNMFLVFATIIIGLRLIRFGQRVVNKLLVKRLKNKALQNLVNNIVVIIFYIFLILVILVILGLEKPITALLASAGVIGLALGLALQDPMMNIFSGAIMSVRSAFEIGDLVETNGFVGSVQEITLKSTILILQSGEVVNIPNKLVLQSPIKNYTTNALRRIEIRCGISYAENLNHVKDVVSEAIKDLAYDTTTRPVEFIFSEFGDSSINFQARFWVKPINMYDYLSYKSIAIINIKAAFDREGITIPFPIRTLDFGIKGGEKLSSMLSTRSI